MSDTVQFIKDNFTTLKLLKNAGGARVETVQDAGGAVFVRKKVPYTGLVYGRIAKEAFPGVPRVYYWAEDTEAGETWVVEEYIQGSTLEEMYEARGDFGEEEARSLGIRLCRILSRLHGAGILHRDIKPSNIMVRGDGEIYLTDFGAAREFSASASLSRDTRILGTPGYAPPEQYGFAATDARSDIYALGVTLKTLLGENCRGDIAKILDKCLALDPGGRVSSAKELEKLLSGRGRSVLLYAAAVMAALFAVLFLAWQLGVFEADKTRSLPPAASVPAKSAAPQDKKDKGAAAKKDTTDKDTKDKNTADAEKKTAAGESAAPLGDKSRAQKSSAPKDSAMNAPQSGPKRAAARLMARGWSGFAVKETPRLNAAEKKLAAKGAKALSRQGAPPLVTVENTSAVPLENPKVELYLTGLALTGMDEEVASWGGRTLRTEYLSPDGDGLCTGARLTLLGTVPPGETMEFPLTAGVTGFYATGKEARLRAVLEADNADAVETGTGIGF